MMSDLPHVKLAELLDPSLPVEPISSLTTEKIRQNVTNYVAKIIAVNKDNEHSGSIAVIETGRGFDRKYHAQVWYDIVPPLRACGVALFLISVDDCHLPLKDRRFFRHLSISERFMLQGHPASTSSDMGPHLARHACGNAYATTMVAMVTLPMARQVAWSLQRRGPNCPSLVSSSIADIDLKQHWRHRGQLQKER